MRDEADDRLLHPLWPGQQVIWIEVRWSRAAIPGVLAQVVSISREQAVIELNLPFLKDYAPVVKVNPQMLRVVCPEEANLPVLKGKTDPEVSNLAEPFDYNSTPRAKSIPENSNIYEACPLCGCPYREIDKNQTQVTAQRRYCAECGLAENYFTRINDRWKIAQDCHFYIKHLSDVLSDLIITPAHWDLVKPRQIYHLFKAFNKYYELEVFRFTKIMRT